MTIAGYDLRATGYDLRGDGGHGMNRRRAALNALI
jgi:hypothetical protein